MYNTGLSVAGFSARWPQHSCKQAQRETESSCSPVASLTRVLEAELPTAWELTHTVQACGQEQSSHYFAAVIKSPAPIFW